jgi:RNA polymerase sigma factor (sigma-70 family)
VTEAQEKLLLKGLASNNSAAVQTIYKENYGVIQSLIINNNGSADDARDIFQEAMIVLYEKTRSGSFELNCQLKTYLYAICRRLWLKKLQSMQKFGSTTTDTLRLAETIPVEDDLEKHYEQNMDFQLMEKALQNLGEPCKSLLEAYYLQKKNMVEIAGNFGYTNADNAKNQKYKCLMRLKKLFFAQYKNDVK